MTYQNKISPTMFEHKRLQFNLELKTIDRDGRFSGYASVFNVVDTHNDIIMRGAFKQSLKSRASEIKLLWQHRQDEPIGVFDRMFEDAHGLYVEGRLLLNVQRAREAYALLKEGAISGLSIGYSPLHYKHDPQTGVRILTAIELWEISLVTFPANAAAGVTVVKEASLRGEAEAIQRAESSAQTISRPWRSDWIAASATPPRNDEKGWLRSGEFIRLQDALDRAMHALSF